MVLHDPKFFVDVSEFIGMHRQMLEKMDRLKKGQDSIHRHVQENQLTLDHIKNNIVKVGVSSDLGGFSDYPRDRFPNVSEFIEMHRQMLKKMDRLLEGQDSLHRQIKEVENKQGSFLDSLQKELKAVKEVIRDGFKDLSKHFERDN